MGKPSRVRRVPKRYEPDDELGNIEEINSDSNRPVQPEEVEVRDSRVLDEPHPIVRTIRRPKSTRSRELVTIQRMLSRTIGVLTRRVNVLSGEVKKTQRTIQETTGGEKESPIVEVTSLNNEGMDCDEVHGNVIKETSPGADIHKYVMCNVKNINLDRPKFGESSIHPVDFIEDLETYLKKLGTSGNELDLIRECLTGSVKDWSRIYKGRWTGLADFKVDFLKAYWGENEQNELRRKIVHGVWNRAETPTMVEHFLKLTGRAQMLSYKIPEKQLIGDIIRHYPKFIQQVFVTNKIETIIEAAEFLRSMDNIQKQEVPGTSTSKNFKEWEKKKRGYQQNYRQWQRPKEVEVQAINLNDNSNVVDSEMLN